LVESLATLSRRRPSLSPEPPLVIGDPDYNAGGGGFRYWEPLPGAKEETRVVAERLGVTAITGAAATPEAVRTAKHPRVMHIVCHGENTALEGALQRSQTSARALISAPQASTLALAGANTSPEGTLSAAEVQTMTLIGTELVVLAGCQTAEGVPAPGEDVVGMRAAFRLAGAGAVLGSLWAVDDEVTRTLMIEFYDRRRVGGDLLDALTGAQEAVRVTHPHPNYWAAWTLLGGIPE
jgi:CHAT domain-containing protein